MFLLQIKILQSITLPRICQHGIFTLNIFFKCGDIESRANPKETKY